MINKNYHWSPSFWKSWLSQAPILCVDAVIFNKSNEVLLVKRATSPYRGFWHLPGGIVRKGETLEVALKRVIETEVSINKFKIKYQLGIFDKPGRDPRGHFITVAFIVVAEDLINSINSQQEEIAFFKNLPDKIGFDAGEIITQSIKKISSS